MSGILVIAEHRRGELNPVTLECIAAAAELKTARGGTVAVAVLAQDPDAYIARLGVAGVDELIKVAVPVAEFQSDVYTEAVLALIGSRRPALVLLPHSIDAWGYAPALAVRGGYGFTTDVFGLRYEGDTLVATRAGYREKVHVELDFPGKATVLLTLRGNAFKAAEGSASPAVSVFDAPAAQPRSQHLEYREPEAGDGVDITQAEYMLSIGRGIGEEEHVAEFEELAERMGFTLGCSRPIADNGWLPKYRQVGQSGKTVSNCKIYVALGISGSVQHMAGMKHVPNIIAVNKDPEASIFNIARYGVVGDIFEIAGELRNHFT